MSLLLPSNPGRHAPAVSRCLTTEQQRRQRKKGDDLMVDGDIWKATTPPGAKECPVAVTISRLGKQSLVMDVNKDEEACSSAKVSVSVDINGNICGVQKTGEGSMPFRQLQSVTESAASVARSLFERKLAPLVNNPKLEQSRGMQNTESDDMLAGVIRFH
jgi:exosome complex RNA-binding protein Rrp42 (RNase PH superfamily)